MRSYNKKQAIRILPAFFLLLVCSFPAFATNVKSAYLYNLSNFSGKIPYSDVRLHVDRARDEVYVLDRGIVKVFNETGMEVFWFGDNRALGTIYDIAVDEKGDLLLLSFDFSHPADGPDYWISKCNYRGDLKGTVRIGGLPGDFYGFCPNRMFMRGGELLLVSTSRMQAIVTDRNGKFQKGYDFGRIVDVPEKDRLTTEIFGFSVDRSGNMLFTVAVHFKAYVVSPEGKLIVSFGKSGSAPGMFGVISGIAVDDEGNYLVVERLRSVVMVFDREFRFVQEFGYRGEKPWNLIRPNEVAVGNSGKLYVTQLRNRGVSVFSLSSYGTEGGRQ
ncbi:MAG: hypothetical protein HY896_06715 [Deltaproteobacteria bacterium]|nr:hypothetical protein [Deltaproteobacteria bacterium]